MTMKATSRTNTASNGMMAKFIAFLIFGELRAVEEISSFDDSSMMSNTAISAPPTPMPTAEVMVIALDAVVAAVEDTMLESIKRANNLLDI